MKIILGIATILGGLSAIWFFWDKIKARLLRLFNRQQTVLDDNFENFNGWSSYRDGNVFHSDEKSHTGKFSLKKSGFNDPNGGIKKICKTGRGILFSGWIYRPSQGDGGPADRLAIEDVNGTGYGFAIRHENDSFFMVIESRIEGAFEKNLIVGQVKSNFNSLCDIWYYFSFQVTKKGKLILNIDCDNQRVGHISTEDLRFTRFHQIAVHGGYPYFVDEIKIRKI